MDSFLVKSLKANHMDFFFHYGIAMESPITMDHIISLILYCDFTTYCTNFSSTFRALGFERMEDTKKRNASFYFESRLFREAIEYYGVTGDAEKDTWEKGPFYTGLNCVLAIPVFNIRLNSPTSTSKDIEVSMKFATRSGMIISYVV